MWFFNKERTGSVETLIPGRRFRWTVPSEAIQKVNTVLDSALLQSWQRVEFHFHLIIGQKGDVGFYIHYKHDHIPKYSFFLAVKGGDRMRQHTAHTIPPDTERCGHWNVCSTADIKALQGDSGAPLEITFEFDADVLRRTVLPEGALEVVWNIPSPTARCIAPLTSPSFAFNGFFYVMRIDEAQDKQSVTLFIFSRSGAVPPHEIALLEEDGKTVVAHQPRTSDMSTQLLRVPHEAVEKNTILVRTTLYRGGNPLEVLNMLGAADSKTSGKEMHPDDHKFRKYGTSIESDI